MAPDAYLPGILLSALQRDVMWCGLCTLCPLFCSQHGIEGVIGAAASEYGYASQTSDQKFASDRPRNYLCQSIHSDMSDLQLSKTQ